MKLDRLVAAGVGLAAGLGVLLVAVDTPETTSAEPIDVTPSAAVSVPTVPTPAPTATAAATVPPTTAAPPEVRTVTFDPRCIGLDLDRDARVTVQVDDVGVLDLARIAVLDELRSRIDPFANDRFPTDDIRTSIESLNLDRCRGVIIRLEGDRTASRAAEQWPVESWFCEFAEWIETSGSLLEWAQAEGICEEQIDQAPPTLESERSDADRVGDTTDQRPGVTQPTTGSRPPSTSGEGE